MSKKLLVLLVAMSAMAVSAAPVAAAKKTPKKTFFTKYEEAVAAAKASERPILLFCSTKGSATDEFYTKSILKNPVFNKEVVKPNLIVLQLQRPALKGTPYPDPKGLSSNVVEVLNYALRSPRCATDKDYEHLYSGVVLIDSEGTKTIGAFLRLPQLQQPRPDTPVNLWMQTLVYFCEAQNVPFTVSPALKKYMETDPDAKPDKKKGKK